MSVCVNQKDLQPTEYDGSIPMFMEKKGPSDDMLQPFDLVRVSILPKNDDGLKKDKKACFSFKSVGSTMRTLSSVLAHLRATMPKSKEDAEQDALQLIRGEGKYAGEKGKVLPYAHQVDSMPPKDNKEDYASSEVTTCAFLMESITSDTTFMYDDNSAIIRMCLKPTGGNPMSVEIPRHAFLKNANATSLHTAAGFYTLASSCPGAMCVFTMHSRFWGSMLWDPMCGYGEPTPYRGAPIVDVSKLLSPLVRSDLYISSSIKVVGEGKKMRVIVPLGFKVPFQMEACSGGDVDDDATDAASGATELLPVMAEVAIVPRKINITSPKDVSPYGISTDMRLSIHGAIPMDIAHVMTVYVEHDTVGKHNILNLDYNAARDVGGTPVVAGKKHTWSSAMPSAIDDDEDDEDAGSGDAVRTKRAMDSVA